MTEYEPGPAQDAAAVATLACRATSAADLRLLCEAVDRPLDPETVRAALSVIRRSRAARKARKRAKAGRR